MWSRHAELPLLCWAELLRSRASRHATRTREIPGCQAVGVAVYARVVTSGFGRGRRQIRYGYGGV